MNRLLSFALFALAFSAPLPIASGKGAVSVDPAHEAGDIAMLAPAWWANFGMTQRGNQPGFVPMSYFGENPAPDCPPILLVFNEPNAAPPYGAPIAPRAAAILVRDIERGCPATLLVALNVSAEDWGGGLGDGTKYIGAFLREYRRLFGRVYRGGIGIHCYGSGSGGVAFCQRQLTRMKSAAGRGRIVWITEAGLVDSTPAEAGRYMTWMAARFARWSWCPVRDVPGAPWALPGWLPLVGQDGELTVTGREWIRR